MMFLTFFREELYRKNSFESFCLVKQTDLPLYSPALCTRFWDKTSRNLEYVYLSYCSQFCWSVVSY